MNGFGIGLLCGVAVGIVFTAVYMFYGVTRPEFANMGWAQAWQLFKMLRKWMKLARDYDRLCQAWKKTNETMAEDVRVLMDTIVKEVEEGETGGTQGSGTRSE